MSQESCIYPVTAIPLKFARVFPYESFNELQSSCLHDVFFGKQSLVLAAPKGSGKTAILDLALCRAWEDLGRNLFAVYIAPTRSLVSKRAADWRQKFFEFGVRIMEITGDVDPDGVQPVAGDCHLLCTTPENLDLQGRGGKRKASLYLIDEVHSIGEPQRGPLLEAVLTRTVVRSRSRNYAPRFIALSADVANAVDIGRWLGRDVDFKVHSFDMRANDCRVKPIVKAFPCPSYKSSYAFDISLDYKLPGIIDNHGTRGQPTLVYVSARRAAVQCAKLLAGVKSWFTVQTLESSLSELQEHLSCKDLIGVVQSGVGFYHGGLSPSDRSLVADSFARGILGILVSTRTKTVSMSAHLVVIRGTTTYSGGSASEYTREDIFEMIASAERKQSGKAVILTKQQELARYEAMLSGKLERVESFLQRDLMRHLMAEIALGNVDSLAAGVDWFKSTFLYVRAETRSRDSGKNAEFEAFVGEQIKSAIKALLAHGLISIEEQSLSRTFLGYNFNRSCLSFGGFACLIAALRTPAPESESSPKDILWMISALPDFASVQIRSAERRTLTAMNSKLCHKVTERPSTWNATHRTFILLQSQLDSIEISESTNLRLERIAMMKTAKSITRFLYESILIFCQDQELRETLGIRLRFSLVRSISLLAKSCRCGMWYDSKFCVQQLEGIGPTRALRLVKGGYTSFDSIVNAEPRTLEIVTQTNPPFGSRLQEQVASRIPRYFLRWEAADGRPLISVAIGNKESLREGSLALALVGDANDSLFYHLRLSHDDLLREFMITTTPDPGWRKLRVSIIDEAIVGVDKEGEIERPTPQATFHHEEREIPDATIDGQGRPGNVNEWLSKELEAAAGGNVRDTMSALFEARAKELVEAHETDGSGAEEKAQNSRYELPDSPEEALGRHAHDGEIMAACVPPSDTGLSGSTSNLTPKRRAKPRSVNQRKSESDARVSRKSKPKEPRSATGRTRKRLRNSWVSNSSAASMDMQEESSVVTVPPRLDECDSTREKHSRENPTEPSALTTGDSEQRVREPPPGSQHVETLEADHNDDEWRNYLRDTDQILKSMFTN